MVGLLYIVICSVVCIDIFVLMVLRPPRSTRTDTLFPDTTLFRSARFAALAGYPSYAAYDFGNRMAGTPERVKAFLDDIDRVVRPIGEADAARMLARLRQDDPSLGALNSCITPYASGLVRTIGRASCRERVFQYG